VNPAFHTPTPTASAVENPAPVVEYQIHMKLPGQLNLLFQAPPLTRLRIILALAFAVVADGLQLLLGFFGWVGADQVIDVATMVLTVWMMGFHWLLLPTFVAEFIPLVGELPTWTACVFAVIALRQREQPIPPKVQTQLLQNDNSLAPPEREGCPSSVVPNRGTKDGG
jgi:hypothetical protein